MMKLNEIAKTSGTYVGVKLDDESCDRLKKLCKELGVPNRVPRDKLHSTIIYSRKHVPDLKADNSSYPIEATSIKLDIFDTKDKKRALVLKIKCKELVKKHNNIMSEYDATYDYDEYIPHVTISYNCGDFNISDFKGELPTVTFSSEYVEDLVLNWQNK